MILTYKYRLKDRSAKKALQAHAKACNQVWNWCTAQQLYVEDQFRAGAKPRRWTTHFDLTKLCSGLGAMLGIHQQTVQEVCHRFAQSRDKIHHSPRFRVSHGLKAATGFVPFQKQSRQADSRSVTYLGKRYHFFGNKRRPLPETAKGGCFVEDTLGRWWVCFTVEVPDRIQTGQGAVGIDLGLKDFATLSNGEKIEAPRIFRQYEQKLATAQRAGQKRRAKGTHIKIANIRKDFHHKVSTSLSARYALIAVGNVNAKQLAQTSMAKSVLDAGWSAFRNMLRYKSPGFVEVDEKLTTQTCSSCGVLPLERPRGIAGLGIREWVCSNCGVNHDRDVNAARNILKLAWSAPRLVEGSRRAA